MRTPRERVSREERFFFASAFLSPFLRPSILPAFLPFFLSPFHLCFVIFVAFVVNLFPASSPCSPCPRG